MSKVFLFDKLGKILYYQCMKSEEIRSKFLAFFAGRGHAIVPSSSLIPDDPSVLLTTAGMQQFKKYYTGEADPMKDFGKKNTASVQKSFRTSDIDEVGDESHLTFFEMLGNFSFGGYFKKEAIQYAYDFIVKEMGLEISYVTVFKGLESGIVPKDEESKNIWRSLGLKDIREEGIEDVFWGPTGSAGPCGSTTEIYCKNAEGKDVEIWNIVFNEFYCYGSRDQLLNAPESIRLDDLPFKGIDTGMGLERLAMISQNTKNIFETDLFTPLMALLPSELSNRTKRIIADHLRASVFLLADGLRPSNKEAGYVLRRLLRRALVNEHTQAISPQIFESVLLQVIENYGGFYPELLFKKNDIINEFWKESEKFRKTVLQGIKEFKNISLVDGKAAFKLFESYGLPFEVIKELDIEKTKGLTRADFDTEYARHQELSRAGLEKKFGGHGLLLDTGELKAADERELKIVTRLHTTTHLLQAALRKVLGNEVSQQGSDITAERTRFDFSFSRKLTLEEIKQVEDILNEAVARDYTVEYKEMSYGDAVKLGALHFFREKYPETVKVYSVFDPKTGEVFSREFCGGPHVTHTGEIGHIKILKEEASSAGIRRIRVAVTL